MFEGIKYRWRLHKLDDKARQIHEKFAEQQKGLSAIELQEIAEEKEKAIFLIFEEIDLYKSAHLYNQAGRLDVPLPEIPYNELWKELPHTKMRILTRKAQWELKRRINDEKRERRQYIALLTALFTAIAGAIGATAGLVAVLSQSR